MMIALTLLLGVLVVLLITAVTGYFVAQEFAYMAVDRSRLNSLAQAGDLGAQRALAVTRRTSFMLSGAQGITVTGLLVGYVAEPLIGESLGTIFGGIGIPTAVGLGIGAVLALLFSTLVQMLFGELFPKNLAIARPEPVARWLARSTTLYLKLFGWLIWIFDQASNLLLRALKIEPVHDVEHSASARDLEHIVAESRETGTLPPELSTMLDRILDFPTRPVEHAMIPRTHVDTVRADDSLDHVITLMGRGHSRYPVVGADSEDIVGVIHLQDVLGLTPTTDLTVRALTRSALIFPTILPCRRPWPNSPTARTNSLASSTNTVDSPELSPSRTSPKNSSAKSPTNTTPICHSNYPARTDRGPSTVACTSTRSNAPSDTTSRAVTTRRSPASPSLIMANFRPKGPESASNCHLIPPT